MAEMVVHKVVLGFLWNFSNHMMNNVIYVGMLSTYMLNKHFSTLDVSLDAGRVKRSLKKKKMHVQNDTVFS